MFSPNGTPASSRASSSTSPPKVIDFPDPKGNGPPLVENILDIVGMKGTGTWTIKPRCDLQSPRPTMAAAVDSREHLACSRTSAWPHRRVLPARKPVKFTGDIKAFIKDVRDALYCSKICSYAQGMALLAAANKAYNYGIHLDEMARIWKAGCIIRAVFLDESKSVQRRTRPVQSADGRPLPRRDSPRQDAWRRIVRIGTETGIGTPAFSAVARLLRFYRRARLPGNLIQAQRNFFGAHTYARNEDPKTMIHTSGRRRNKFGFNRRAPLFPSTGTPERVRVRAVKK